MAKEPKKQPNSEAFQEEVRKIAGEIYKKRTAENKPGDAFLDWLEAEKRVKAKYKV